MIDDRTTTYVIAAQPVFEDLRQVAAQIAGLLVLAATGSKDSTPDHPMLLLSRQVFAQADEGVRRATPLVTESTCRHYQGISGAGASLRLALDSAGAWPLDVEAVLAPLRDAYAHLQQAASALPGFQMVSFEQACCSVRATV